MSPPSTFRIRVDGTRFRDSANREVILHGLNVAADAKFPAGQPSHIREGFFEGDDVSFVGRPFAVEDARTHFSRIRKWGFNTIRYIFTWEAIEHAGPGKYDEDWIKHTISILRIAGEYGFTVFMDPHQDTWSRHCGGSGAPMWTIYACGLDPKNFRATDAAVVHNTYPNPEEFPKMIWNTNYNRLACQVIFTMFWAGREYTPHAIIDGKNIQDYLQDHFLAACEHLAKAIHDVGDLEDTVVVGWEMFNESNKGLIGHENLDVIPSEQKNRKGTTPTAFQAIMLGSGLSCEVDEYDMGWMGPYWTGKHDIDPAGHIAWLSEDRDAHYGWQRDPEWKLGKCIWAQQGVWDPQTKALLKPDYFAKDPRNGAAIDHLYFTNHWCMDMYRKYRRILRAIHKDCILFLQASPYEFPPKLTESGDPDDDDPNMVFAPHWYDGITLMTKYWNPLYNVDIIGIMRHKYFADWMAVKIGESAIRNCFKNQLITIKDEGNSFMRPRPCVFTEIGIPYDMDDRKAYETGDFSSQISAMDANHFALEGSGIQGFTLWNYTAMNNHKWGDHWVGEDLSLFSHDDRLLPTVSTSLEESTSSLDPNSPSYSRSKERDIAHEGPSTLAETLAPEPEMSSSKTSVAGDASPHTPGYRAAEAFVRPWPNAVHGDVLSFGFNLRECVFELKLVAASSTPEDAPTEIFLPAWHFPTGKIDVETSGGHHAVSLDGETRKLAWWHSEGEQSIRISGEKKPLKGLAEGTGEYLAYCWRN